MLLVHQLIDEINTTKWIKSSDEKKKGLQLKKTALKEYK